MGLKTDMDEILDYIKEQKEGEKKKKEKDFKLPFLSRVRGSQAKKNYVTVMKINENGNVTFKKKQIENQAFLEDDVPRLGTAEYVLRYKKNPMIILPSWSVQPYSPSEQYNKSLNDGSNTKGYAVLLDYMLSKGVSTKKQMGGAIKWIIGLAVAAVIGYALITGGG